MMQQPPQTKQIAITPDMVKNAAPVKCDECGNLVFTEKLTFKKMSAILSPSGKEEMIPIPIVVCDNCGKVSKIFDPDNLLPREIRASIPGKGVPKISPPTATMNIVKDKK